MKPSTSKRITGLLGTLLLWLCACDDSADPALPGVPNGAANPSSTAGAGGTDPAAVDPTAPTPTGDGNEANPMPVDLEGVGGAAAGGGAPEGDAGTEPALPPNVFDGRFILGADISSVDEALDFGVVFVDTDGVEKSLLELLKNHGFNYIRLRTFVDPLAQYGYASGDQCQAKAEAYADKDHTIAFAQQIKAAGMGLLLDFHYSDTWADPGKQVIPEAWRNLDTIAAMAEQVRAYTTDVMTGLIAAGARPDMVQVGNEITPGMLIHVPSADTDCYGSNSTVRPGVNGSQNDWDNLAALLRAGIAGVRDLDPSIRIMLHIENTESATGVTDWVQNAQSRGVQLDVLGLSAYAAFQGPASAWRETFTQLATNLPDLSFAIAEYNPERRLLNDIMRELPDGRGLGTFFWEPTQSGEWGAALFTWQGNRAFANGEDFAEYDQMRADFGL
jgi:arabinogalactan endo-1,4-beta-galactosidase